jgi:hypothetical protein
MPQKGKYNENITSSLGGGNILIDILRKFEIIEFIDQKLGPRNSPRSEYTYGEGMASLLISQFKGDKRIEDLYGCQDDLLNHPRFGKGMSPDTLLYMCKQLATAILSFENKSAQDENVNKRKPYLDHQINVHHKFNELFLDLAIKLQLLNTKNKYTLDFDTTEILSKIIDCRRTYKSKGKKRY